MRFRSRTINLTRLLAAIALVGCALAALVGIAGVWTYCHGEGETPAAGTGTGTSASTISSPSASASTPKALAKAPYVPKLSTLAAAPDWTLLEPYQRTMTRQEFVRWIDEVYAPNGAFWRYAVVDDEKLVLYGEASPAPAPVPASAKSPATAAPPSPSAVPAATTSTATAPAQAQGDGSVPFWTAPSFSNATNAAGSAPVYPLTPFPAVDATNTNSDSPDTIPAVAATNTPLPPVPAATSPASAQPPPTVPPPAPEVPRTPLFTLFFAKDDAQAKATPKPVHYKPEPAAPWALPPENPAKPLQGVRILLDPGHIGGEYAAMEERFFQIGVGKPAVVEGDLTYQTCRHVEKALVELGAEIAWTKEEGQPATSLRAKDLRDAAIKYIANSGGAYPTPPTAQDLVKRLNREANSLFYRTAEIRARADKVPKFKPDLIICVHYNASPWGYERKALLNDVDRLVVFINGMYSFGELANDDQKFAVMLRVLARITPLELNISDRVSAEMAASLGLPPETYRGSPTMRQMGANPYVFARNLLANRIFDAPVVYVEGPYMNSKSSYPRFAAGDYEGERNIEGKMRPSIVREMAHCITRGVLAYYTHPPRNAEGRSPRTGPAEWPWPPLTSDLNPAPLPPFPPPPPPKPPTSPATNAPPLPPPAAGGTNSPSAAAPPLSGSPSPSTPSSTNGPAIEEEWQMWPTKPPAPEAPASPSAK